MFNPIKWLLTKNEPATKETAVTDTTATDTTATAEPVTVTTTSAQGSVIGVDGNGAATDESPSAGTTQTTTTTVVSEPATDAVLAQLKKLVEAAGAQAYVVFDDLIDVAKKLA